MNENETAPAMTVTQVGDIRRIERPESISLATAEVARMVGTLRLLNADDWALPTQCPAWDVRDLAGHVLGMTETFTGLRPMVTTMRAGKAAAGEGPFIDGLTAVQVRNTAELSTNELIQRLERAAGPNARFRGSRRLMRRMPLKQEMPDGVETWKLGYLVDIILTRDTWMHRVDLSRATDRPMELTADHDGRIVADAVSEWASRHGRPFLLHLTGPAGGSFAQGTDAEELTFDAVDFCQVLSGRGQGEGLLSHQVPF